MGDILAINEKKSAKFTPIKISTITVSLSLYLLIFFLQIAPNVVLSEEEIEYRLKQEYQQYVDEETSFLRELGILKEEDEPLPET